MMGRSIEDLEAMARDLLTVLTVEGEALNEKTTVNMKNNCTKQPEESNTSEDPGFWCSITYTQNVVGGGTTPGKTLPGVALKLKSKCNKYISAQEINDHLRRLDVPIIGHIVDDWVYLELRTLLPGDFEILKKELINDL